MMRVSQGQSEGLGEKKIFALPGFELGPSNLFFKVTKPETNVT